MKGLIRYSIELESGLEYYKVHLTIINSMLPVQLTPTEIEVLATFLSVPEGIKQNYIFNTGSRAYVKAKLNISASGLSNYLKPLINKGFIIKDKDTKLLSVNSLVVPEETVQLYNFKISKNEVQF